MTTLAEEFGVSGRGLAKICQRLRRPGTAAGLLGKASKSCAADPGRRAAISSLLVCRFRSRADLDLEVVARLRPRLAHGRLYERRLWFGDVSKVRLNAYDNVAIDSHAIQSAAERISHDLEQCRYLARPVHRTRWITK